MRQPNTIQNVCNLVLVAIVALTNVASAAELSEKVESRSRSATNTAPSYQPKVQPASDEAQRQIATFRVPPGMKVELFAAEPDMANPVAFCFDEKGRVYVAETYRIRHGAEDNRWHMYWLDDDLAAQTVDDRVAFIKKHQGEKADDWAKEHDLVRLLEDRAGKGKVDHSTIFADGFHELPDGIGAGVLAYRGNVYYTCIPHLWLLRDEAGQGHATIKRSLHDGYGVHFAFVGHDMHGLIVGPDGKLYYSIGDRGLNVDLPDRHLLNIESGSILRCDLDGSNLEIFATGFRNPQELAFDDYGNLFTCDNNSDSGDQARWTYIVEGMDAGWRMAYQYLADRGPFNREKLWYPHFDGQAAYIVPPIANLSDGPSGLCYDPGVGLSDKYRGSFFLADFRGTPGTSGVRAIRVKPKGAGFELSNNEKFWWSILATDVAFGPDCQLYVSDWVEGWDGAGKGRIYRIVDSAVTGDAKAQAAAQDVKQLLAGDWDKVANAELVKLLAHADRRVRQEAQFELVRRKAAIELSEVALSGANRLARIHALWGVGQIGAKTWKDIPAAINLTKLFADSDPEIRAQAAKVLGAIPSVDCNKELIGLFKDESPRVRSLAALALGKRDRIEAAGALVKMIAENNDVDPVLRHAGIVGLAGSIKGNEIAKQAADAARPVRLAAVVALRRQKDPAVASFLKDEDPLIVLEAARAIHDVPIEAALPALAAAISRPFTGGPEDADAFYRRVLNANYRLGGSERAAALAQFAASSDKSASDSLRVEALGMLGESAQPSAHDRVLNMWRPIEPRDAAPVADAIRGSLDRLFAMSSDVKRAAAHVAGKLGVIEAAPALAKLVGDPSRDTALRVEALKMLDVLGEMRLWEITDQALADKEALVRIEARRLLTKQRAGKALVELKSALENGEPIERQAALAQLQELKLPGADEVLEAAMDQLSTGKIPLEMQLDLLEAVAERGTPKLKEKLAGFEKMRPKSDPLAEYREAMAGGDAVLGERIFRDNTELSCRRCHKVGHGAGGVGPELTSIAAKLGADFSQADAVKGIPASDPQKMDRRVREYLLESVVLPNKTIAKGFESLIILGDDGRQHSGVVQGEDEKQIRLMGPDGKLDVVSKDAIDERRIGPSAMPADLVKHLSKRQLRDLVEFLASLKGQYAEPPLVEQPEGTPAN